MRDRQEKQRGGPFGQENLVEPLNYIVDLEHQVAMCEHAALGPAGGSGGVDDGGN